MTSPFCAGYTFEFLYPSVIYELQETKDVNRQKEILKWLDWNLGWYMSNTNYELFGDNIIIIPGETSSITKYNENHRRLKVEEIKLIFSAIESTKLEKFIMYFKQKFLNQFNWNIGKKRLLDEGVLIPVHNKTRPVEAVDISNFTDVLLDLSSTIKEYYLNDNKFCLLMKPSFGDSISNFYSNSSKNRELHEAKTCICFCQCNNCWHIYCSESQYNDCEYSNALFKN